MNKLPIIDFSNFKPQTPTWDSVKIQVMKARKNMVVLRLYSMKYLLISRKSIIDRSQLLFDLPLQNKLRNRSDKPYQGYIGQYPMVPLYESLGIEDAVFRVQKYDAPKSQETKIGLTSHTDKNIVTILYGNEVKGLEVLTKDSNWINAEPSMNSFIVMIGDFFHAWTNGRMHSAHHRVTMAGDEARYSFGLFSIPKSAYIIKAPKEMVDEEHPLLFKPYDHLKLMEFYYIGAGRSSPNTLKTYCGA
ncbi:hypothetical protein DH2020_041352 [Rehmannia glutinosa]|uniref:Fe2OG dioxygenase domain-containing protein n=1 Tax=Rehmannia glutinosa TaxID=99300 RepID=A0ABR0URK5_REHGL